jgi:hypothetical protein
MLVAGQIILTEALWLTTDLDKIGDKELPKSTNGHLWTTARCVRAELVLFLGVLVGFGGFWWVLLGFLGVWGGLGGFGGVGGLVVLGVLVVLRVLGLFGV